MTAIVEQPSVNDLVAHVIEKMSRGVPKQGAIDQVLGDIGIDDIEPATRYMLVSRGLGLSVAFAIDHQKFGQFNGNTNSNHRLRGGNQIAPGKRSEWERNEKLFPNLTTIPYADIDGIDIMLLRFSIKDWERLRDTNNVRKVRAAGREKLANQALEMMRAHGAKITEELPKEELAALDDAAGAVWRQ